MQDEKVNSNELLTDEQMEDVSGGKTMIIAHLHPEIEVTCTCGQSFFAPYNAAGKYQCPVCKATIIR